VATNAVKATCIVEVQVDCYDSWQPDTTMAQIVEQAEKSATARIQKVFSDSATDDKDLSTKRESIRGIGLIGVKKITTQLIALR
jgi:hypothetical protein